MLFNGLYYPPSRGKKVRLNEHGKMLQSHKAVAKRRKRNKIARKQRKINYGNNH